jgi:hypothetical protein
MGLRRAAQAAARPGPCAPATPLPAPPAPPLPSLPAAQVYVAPFQWSFPLNLPPQVWRSRVRAGALTGTTRAPASPQQALLPAHGGTCLAVAWQLHAQDHMGCAARRRSALRARGPQLFGIFPAGELRTADPDVPWAEDIEQKVFLPPSIGEACAGARRTGWRVWPSGIG